MSVVKRFSRENVNDAGETLSLAVAGMIFMEFKKFMFLCVLELKEQYFQSKLPS